MPTPLLAKQADTVRADLARLEADIKTLLSSVGGAIGSAIGDRIGEPMKVISGQIEPLLKLLGSTTAPAKRGPGRPPRAAGARPAAWTKRGPRRPPKAATAPASAKPRRGGRGKKANLTPDAIQAAITETKGNKSAAARVLGVSLPTFYKYHGAAAPAAAKPVKKKGK